MGAGVQGCREYMNNGNRRISNRASAVRAFATSKVFPRHT